MIALAVLASLRPAGRWLRSCRTVAACVGMALVAVSATPLPGWSYLAAGVLSFAWLGAEGRAARGRPVLRRGLRLAVLAACVLGVAAELPYHLPAALPHMGRPEVHVVGDSISAGMGGEAETWPRILARRHAVRVDDLSLAGATVASALRDQAGRVSGTGSLVIAEIGGNDLLGATTPASFERGLDALLGRLREGGRTVILLELPLPPSYNRFGAAQRRLTRRHGVVLVPKRVLLGVLTAPGATLDSIHLSRSGHALMAETMWGVIRRAFGPRGGETIGG